jgi:hypothetical protein
VGSRRARRVAATAACEPYGALWYWRSREDLSATRSSCASCRARSPKK